MQDKFGFEVYFKKQKDLLLTRLNMIYLLKRSKVMSVVEIESERENRKRKRKDRNWQRTKIKYKVFRVKSGSDIEEVECAKDQRQVKKKQAWPSLIDLHVKRKLKRKNREAEKCEVIAYQKLVW